MLFKTKLIITQRKIPPTSVESEIQPSFGSSKERKPSPLHALKMQSISHINVDEAKISANISKCNFLRPLKTNKSIVEIIAHASAVRK